MIFIASLSTLSLRAQSFAVFEDDLLDDPQLTQKAEAGIKYTPRVPSPEDVEVTSHNVEYIELVPYGGTELRLTVFPVIK